MLTTTETLYGSRKPLPRRLQLQAGPLTMVFEPELAFLRTICYGEHELLRGIYVAVRDRNWGTVPPQVTDLQHKETDNGFELLFDVACEQGEISFTWQGRICAAADGTISYTMDGTAQSDFLRNRIGFCVLHPVTAAGMPCQIEHTDGSVEASAFPTAISPHQPFMDVRAMSHAPLPGATCEVRFTGDVFETEDQRNWTDASFKTYCTPLSLPFPVEVKRGTRVAQAVTVAVRAKATQPPAIRRSEAVRLSVGDRPCGRLPSIGLGVASHGCPLTEAELERLRMLQVSHLRVDLRLYEPTWQSTFAQAAAEAKALDAGLEIALFVSDNAEAELRAVREYLEQARPEVRSWLVFHRDEKSTGARWVLLASEWLAGTAPIGAGSNAYFTEINRQRPPVNHLDIVCYSVNPQVHAFDNWSLVENLAGQGETVRSARLFSGAARLAVTPVTFRPRFNPDATGAVAEQAPGELPPQVDPRQFSLFGAGWTMGSIKHLSEAGVDSITYYETTGWRGVMEMECPPVRPEAFSPPALSVFPLFHTLADVGEYRGGVVLPATSSAPLQAEVLALQNETGARVLVASFSAETLLVSLDWPACAEKAHFRLLSLAEAAKAAAAPEDYRRSGWEVIGKKSGLFELRLPPFAYACIDMG